MNKLKEIVVYILAAVGLAVVVKHMHITTCKEGCCVCNLFRTKEGTTKEEGKTKAGGLKTKVEGIKTKAEGFKTKVGEIKTKVHVSKTKEESEKRIGSRYGSNPVRY